MAADDLTGRTVAVGSVRTTLAEPIDDGSGKEGTVYRVTTEADTTGRGGSDTSDRFVAKVIREGKRSEKREKTEAMVRSGIDDPAPADGEPYFAWPAEVVRDAGTDAFLGYLMPYVGGRDAQKFASARLGWGDGPPRLGYLTALNLSIAIASLHAQGHAMRDMHHDNVFVDDGDVALIDCDGFYVGGRRRNYPSRTYYPRYAPPEVPDEPTETAEPAQRADRFGLAVHVFQFLMAGFHPFQAKGSGGDFGQRIADGRFAFANSAVDPPDHAPPYRALPGRIRALFAKCFEYGKRRPRRRPTARDWIQVLGETVEL
jgi:DNA-binding helix-hairpin-helix protein with protein kinase domain